MFKLKSKLIVAVMAIFGITAFMSCEKNELISSTVKETEFNGSNEKMTLDEFIQSVETEDERRFFAKHNIIDNRKVASKVLNSAQLKAQKQKPRIKFKWGGSGCVNPIGICIIIPFGVDNPNAEVVIADGKYVVFPKTNDNGITSDGYLPIYEDLYIDEATTIKAGIYMANYDEQLGKYTAIALDIK